MSAVDEAKAELARIREELRNMDRSLCREDGYASTSPSVDDDDPTRHISEACTIDAATRIEEVVQEVSEQQAREAATVLSPLVLAESQADQEAITSSLEQGALQGSSKQSDDSAVPLLSSPQATAPAVVPPCLEQHEDKTHSPSAALRRHFDSAQEGFEDLTSSLAMWRAGASL